MRGKKTINFITLGCSKNIVDSEFIMKQLEGKYKLAVDKNALSDIVIINTCGFIGDAKEESIDTVLQYAAFRQSGDISRLYVMGCLSERYKKELEKEIPEVDRFFGVSDFSNIIQELKTIVDNNLLTSRCITTPKHYSYLKISEGCDWKCSYCAIPLIRGRHISKPIETLVEEGHRLIEQGVKEINLIAQDLTYYGVDLYKKRELPKLLKALTDIKGLEWIRMQYAYPFNFPMEILDLMKDIPSICHYLDIPLQHINTTVLQKMRRGVNAGKTYGLLEELRRNVPDIALRTTLIVGHPGEGKDEFKELLDFVRQVRFDRLGVFTYSEEEGTYGAKNYPDSIPQDVKQERLDQIMELQAGISKELNEKKIGKQFKVLIDRQEGNYLVGRTQYDAPEVDNEVLINSDDQKIKVGEFCHVAIDSVEEYDLFGEIVKQTSN